MPRFEAKYSLAVLIANAGFPIALACYFLSIGLLWPWLWALVGATFLVQVVFFCQPISFLVEGEQLTLRWVSGRTQKMSRSEVQAVKSRSLMAVLAGATELKIAGGKAILIHTRFMVNGPALRAWLPQRG
jgi:hypothetical protein